jgi:hypothetical protein
MVDARVGIEELEEPDFELLLKVEKANKDRKGMKNFIKMLEEKSKKS